MANNKKKGLLAFLLSASTLMAGCSKWTETELKDAEVLTETNRSEEYYRKLRAFKESDHQRSYVWYDSWTGKGATGESLLSSLPDSLDIVALWGGWKNLTPEQKADLKFVQEKKGTKVVFCFLVLDIGGSVTPDIPEDKKELYADGSRNWRHDFWGWSTENTDEGLQKRIAAAEKYANAICDTIDKYGYDGFDIDVEPSYAHPFATQYEMWRVPGSINRRDYRPAEAFIKAMGRRIGPMAETEEGRKKLFIIDGEPEAFSGETGKYFSFFINQAYRDRPRSGSLERRLRAIFNAYDSAIPREEIAKRWIITSNFESYASTGGSGDAQLLHFAVFNPVIDGVAYQKGGVGIFRPGFDYRGKPADKMGGFDMTSVQGRTYPWLRRAIDLMNPVIY